MKKLVFLLLIVSVLFTGFVVIGNLQSGGIEVVNTTTARVGSGDTIWSFVNEVDGREDYNGHQLVELIRRMNDLEPADHLHVGHTITIPKEVK